MKTPHRQQGFTLIEMIVSLGVFSVVVLAAVGALLILVATSRQLQGEQSVMTNLSFALDSMTREIRTGTHYYCDHAANYSAGGGSNIFSGENDLDALLQNEEGAAVVQLTQDCTGAVPTGHNLIGMAFIEGGDSITASNERILYFYDETAGKIFRRIGDDEPESVTSSGLFIRDFKLTVTGSDPLSSGSGERDQPSVTIYIEASDVSDSTKIYKLQTTVTQRTLDL